MSEKNETKIYQYARIMRRSEKFTVRINGEEADVLYREFGDLVVTECTGELEIEVLSSENPADVKIRPLSKGMQPEIIEGGIRFTISEPVNLVIGEEDYHPLFFHACPPVENVPDPDDPKVHYFRAGQVYEVEHMPMEDDETIYLEGGAVVRGSLLVEGSKNLRICGHGVWDGSYHKRATNKSRCFVFKGCENVTVEDISMIEPCVWTLVFIQCKQVHVRNIVQITWGNGSDGIDIVGCQDVHIEGCLLRNGDDCVVVKSVGMHDFKDPGAEVKNVLVERCALMNIKAGNALEIGHELNTEKVHNITFRDIDVLCAHGHGAVFSINNADCATISDVLYEDIRVEHHYAQLIGFRVIRSRWSKQQKRGYIRDIHLKNIRIAYSDLNEGYTLSVIGGFNEAHSVENVTLEDISINDRKIMDANDLDLYMRNTKNVVFK